MHKNKRLVHAWGCFYFCVWFFFALWYYVTQKYSVVFNFAARCLSCILIIIASSLPPAESKQIILCRNMFVCVCVHVCLHVKPAQFFPAYARVVFDTSEALLLMRCMAKEVCAASDGKCWYRQTCGKVKYYSPSVEIAAWWWCTYYIVYKRICVCLSVMCFVCFLRVFSCWLANDLSASRGAWKYVLPQRTAIIRRDDGNAWKSATLIPFKRRAGAWDVSLGGKCGTLNDAEIIACKRCKAFGVFATYIYSPKRMWMGRDNFICTESLIINKRVKCDVFILVIFLPIQRK